MARKKVEADPPKFNKARLADLFGINRSTVGRRLSSVKPDGADTKGNPLYTVNKAAQYLVDYDDIRDPNMPEDLDPDDMPPDMRDDHWAAELKKQKWLLQEGDLWTTAEVMELTSGMLKPLAHNIRSIPDALERKHRLTPKQIDGIEAECDRALKVAYESLKDYAADLSEPG